MAFSDRFQPHPGSTLIERTASLPRALLAAVGVGVAFGTGLVMGGIGKAEAAVAPLDQDPVARAEARTKAYEDLMKGTQLSWHRELTARDPPLPPLPVSKVATTTPKAKPLPEAATASPLVDKAIAAPDPEPVVVAPLSVDSSAPDSAVDDSDLVVRPDPKQLNAAMARVLGDKKPAASTPEKRYAVQLASTGTEAGARLLADEWKQRGHKAVVAAADVAGKGTMYRVRIGGIASRAAADALKLRLGQGLVVAD